MRLCSETANAALLGRVAQLCNKEFAAEEPVDVNDAFDIIADVVSGVLDDYRSLKIFSDMAANCTVPSVQGAISDVLSQNNPKDSLDLVWVSHMAIANVLEMFLVETDDSR